MIEKYRQEIMVMLNTNEDLDYLVAVYTFVLNYPCQVAVESNKN